MGERHLGPKKVEWFPKHILIDKCGTRSTAVETTVTNPQKNYLVVLFLNLAWCRGGLNFRAAYKGLALFIFGSFFWRNWQISNASFQTLCLSFCHSFPCPWVTELVPFFTVHAVACHRILSDGFPFHFVQSSLGTIKRFLRYLALFTFPGCSGVDPERLIPDPDACL
jgi:hypothetical protein